MSTNVKTAGRHIAELVAIATRAGIPDAYHAKRQRPRYRLRMPMELATTPETPAEDILSGELHDISLTGVGVWCDREFREKTELVLREWRPDGAADWIPIRVVHCTRGLTGVLIGAEFLEEAAETGAADAEMISDPSQVRLDRNAAAPGPSATPAGGSELARRGRELPVRAARFACISVLLSASAIFGGSYILAGQWPTALVGAALTLACGGLAALGAWAAFRGDGKWLRVLGGQVQELTTSPPNAANGLLRARTNEGLDELVTRLRAEIDQHHAALATQRQRVAELDEVESTILNLVAHDLRTPLTSILLYAEVLRTELTRLDAGEQEHYLQIISVETQRLARLIDNLTNAQRVNAGELQAKRQHVEIAQIVAQAARDFGQMAHEKQIALETECDPGLPGLHSDGGQISQILNNLIANALQFTPRGGRVMVLAEATPTEVVVSVSDNGPGVPREHWDRIFDRFTQVNPTFTDVTGGVGVGLFVVRELVDHLGGRIWLDSELGKGSEFCVAFPRAAAPPSRNGQSARGRVLVCDTDAELASRIVQLLSQHGFATDVAYCGRRVLEKLSEREYDVVVTDLLFRDLGPEQLLPQLTRGRRAYRLIAHAHGPEATELRARGFDIVLGRPAEREELVQAVEMALQVKPNCATILIAAPAGEPLADYAQQLAEAGNLPVLVPTLREAAGQLTDYPFDRILISARLLDERWSELAMFEQHSLPTGALVVVCQQLGRAERAHADEWGVGAATLNALRKQMDAGQATALRQD